MSDTIQKELVVVGGGPAGCAAALFAAKSKRKVTLFQKETNSLKRRNHWFLPGIGMDLDAKRWLTNLQQSLTESAVEVIDEEVTEATLGASVKSVTVASGKIFNAKAIVFATGCFDRHGLIEGEAEFSGRGVYYNAYQDGSWFEGKTIVAEGKGEEAALEVLHLTRFAQKIYFIVPAIRLEIENRVLNQLKKSGKVDLLTSASVKKIEGDEVLRRVVVLTGGEEKGLDADGVFLYARQSTAQYPFLKGTIEISEDGAILVDDQLMTSIPGVFACGDMISGVPQLAFASTAQGLVAAMYADRYLANLEFKGG